MINTKQFSQLACLSILAMTLLFSCNSTKQAVDKTVGDGHNSQNALDWAGTYAAMLPCADCEGIQTSIKLNQDQTFSIRSRYEGSASAAIVKTGKFTWDKTGSKITLNIPGEDNLVYQVKENALQQLDKTGKRIEGQWADRYSLPKQIENDIREKYWKLTELMGQPIHFTGSKEPHMILKMTDSTVQGFAGCNGFRGKYEFKGRLQIHFSQILSTKMACPDLKIEQEFMKALGTADNYSQRGDTLYLNKARMAPLAKFEAVYM